MKSNGHYGIIKAATLLFVVSIVFNSIIGNLLGMIAVFAIRILSILIIVIYRIISKNYKINAKYLILLVVTLLPFCWNNAYIQDLRYKPILDYLLTIIFSILTSNIFISGKHISRYFVECYMVFAIATSLVTILSLIFPTEYLSIAKILFPTSTFLELSEAFKIQSLFGLTDHYSRNAFYIVVGIICVLYLSENPALRRGKYILLALFTISLLLIGKRGHLLFLIISLFIGYIIIKKISLKTVVKISAISVISVMLIGLIVSIIPEANRTFNRFIASSGSDISSGRFDMYEDARVLYEDNGRIPIGWGQYAKSTNYHHPALHNDYLQLYYEVGLIGSILVLVPNAILLYLSYRRLREEPKNALLKVALIYNIFFNIYAMTGLPRYDLEVYTAYFVINGCLMNRVTANEKEQ